MTTNFTFRDFFVYLLTGILLIACLGIIFYENILHWSVNFFGQYEFIKEFSFFWTILLVPIIYLVGHIIGSVTYNLLQFYVCLDKKFKRPMPKWKYFILIKWRQILYKQRVIYAIIECTKSDRTEKIFKSKDEFWMLCAKLQVENAYSRAEYWYVLNELFNSANTIFFISTIMACFNGQWILGVIFLVLTIFSFRRANQYASHFVQTVCNLIIAKQLLI